MVPNLDCTVESRVLWRQYRGLGLPSWDSDLIRLQYGLAIGNRESTLDDFNSQTESARSLGRFYWTLICSCLNHVTRGKMMQYINSQYNPNRGLCFSSEEFLFLVFYLKDGSCMFLALWRVWPSAHLLSLSSRRMHQYHQLIAWQSYSEHQETRDFLLPLL